MATTGLRKIRANTILLHSSSIFSVHQIAQSNIYLRCRCSVIANSNIKSYHGKSHGWNKFVSHPFIGLWSALGHAKQNLSLQSNQRSPGLKYSTSLSKSRNKPLITLFTKEDCSLCDVAKEILANFKDRCDIEEIDIGKEDNAAWFEKYKYDIPVLHLNNKFLMKHKVFAYALEDALVNLERSAVRRNKANLDETMLFFSGNFIDRCTHVRKDHEQLQAKMEKETSKFVIFKNLNPLIYKPNHSKNLSLKAISFKDLCAIHSGDIDEVRNEMVFLGMDKAEVNKESDWFALNLTNEDTEEKLFNLIKQDNAAFIQSFPGMLKLSEKESSLAAQSRGLLAWHQSHQFCSACGSRSLMSEGGYKRACSNDACKTKQAQAHHISYPRVDPVTMVLVISPDNKSILLARQPSFPRDFFTCLAGFVEPGESLETAVKREVYEECNIHVSGVHYRFSQYWPYPSSLMLGCIATANDTNIRLDTEELEEAFWVSREEAAHLISPKTLKAYNAGEKVKIAPPKQSLAHQLIKYWIEN